jgi:SP family general alpha glucoside:H+ symporter-like MFS transporter
MINQTAWNWGAMTGFYWAFWCTFATVWCYFRLPEMKGRSYRELDVLFERRIPARQFKSTVVSLEADTEIMQARDIQVDVKGHEADDHLEHIERA